MMNKAIYRIWVGFLVLWALLGLVFVPSVIYTASEITNPLNVIDVTRLAATIYCGVGIQATAWFMVFFVGATFALILKPCGCPKHEV